MAKQEQIVSKRPQAYLDVSLGSFLAYDIDTILNSLLLSHSSQNLSKSYDGKIVLDKIDFTLRQGEIYGLLGRNGTGKTTFIKAILGLTAMDSGESEYSIRKTVR